jgi:hypothetical protein
MKSFLVLLLLVGGTASAQQAVTPPAASGEVSGMVRCHDTGRPCRFAGIVLLPEIATDEPSAPALNLADPGPGNETAKILARAMISDWSRAAALSSVTDLQGKFSIAKVPVGTYYAMAELVGYVSAVSGLSEAQREKPDAHILAAVQGRSQRIVVLAGQTVDVKIELERGAVLDGTVTYADGTPASGADLGLLVRAADGTWHEIAAVGTERVQRGNRGEFHFFGLPPGDYAVAAHLPTSQALTGIGTVRLAFHSAPGDALTVYSGGAYRQSQIKPIHLGAAETRSVKLVFPLEGLHTIAGRVLAASDHHAVNTGIIELQDPANKAAVRTVLLGRDGAFQMRYVPAGDYLLSVTASGDTQGAASDLLCARTCREIRSYAPMSLPLALKADAAGLELNVADAGAP